jgi:hypothetical protein
LRPSCGISIYQELGDDGSTTIVLVYEAGPRRGLVRTSNSLAPHDAPDIIVAIEEWRERRRPSERWSLEEDELPEAYPG